MSRSVNILIVIRGSEENVQQKLFNEMKKSIHELIGRDKFTIYAANVEDIGSRAWLANTYMLIVINNDPHFVNDVIEEFMDNEGKYVCLSFDQITSKHANERIFNSENFKIILNQLFNTSSSSDAEFVENITLSEAYLVIKRGSNGVNINDIKSNERISSKIQFLDGQKMHHMPSISEDDINTKIPVVLNADLSKLEFNFEAYFSSLSTRRLGHLVLFADVTTSTMHLSEPFSEIDGFVTVANRQTKGKGRRGNEWLSPRGCATFSVQLSISLSSKLGQRLGFVQHLASIAIVTGIQSIPGGYKNLDLRIRWPNDIYGGQINSKKLAGILVSCVSSGNRVNCLIGAGINVSNYHPSLCLHEIIDEYNRQHPGEQLLHLEKEEIIARIVTQLEKLLNDFEKEGGVDRIKELYLKHWIHSDQTIKLIGRRNEDKEVTSEGLDDQGFLLVRDKHTGLLKSVHPDGNRFDMFHNLKVH